MTHFRGYPVRTWVCNLWCGEGIHVRVFPRPHSVPGTRYPVPSTQYSVPSTQYPVLSTQYSVPSTQYWEEKGSGLFDSDGSFCYPCFMARPSRADEAGGLYHALNRGNARATIFHKDGDYEAFERILAEGLEAIRRGVARRRHASSSPFRRAAISGSTARSAANPTHRFAATAIDRRYRPATRQPRRLRRVAGS